MNLIERVKNILVTPKTEWEVINGETASPMSLLTSYVLPLAIVASVGSILKYFFFSTTLGMGSSFMIGMALVGFIASVISFYLSAIIIDMLAPSFSSEKDLNKSAQLVAYSGTPSYIAGLLSFIPIIGGLLAFAAWGYGIYLMYLGIGPLKKTPEDKKIVYMLVAFAIMIVIYLVIAAILGAVVLSTLGGVAAISTYGR
jgi:F0F1-type ATP synthase assembly protein I